MFHKIIFSVAKVTAYLIIIPAMIALLMGGYKYANSLGTPSPEVVTQAQLDAAIKGENVSKIIPSKSDDNAKDAPDETELKSQQAKLLGARNVIVRKLGAEYDSTKIVEYLQSQTSDLTSKQELMAYENLAALIKAEAPFEQKSKLLEAYFPLLNRSVAVAKDQEVGSFERYGIIATICFSLLLISVFSVVLIGLDNRKSIQELRQKIGN